MSLLPNVIIPTMILPRLFSGPSQSSDRCVKSKISALFRGRERGSEGRRVGKEREGRSAREGEGGEESEGERGSTERSTIPNGE